MKIDPPSTVGGQQPKDCTAWLQRHSLKLGLVKGDGLCQYSAFSKAAFSTDKHAKELRTLAVAYLRLHKSAYAESMHAELRGRNDALFKLFKAKKINSVGYDGYMEALELEDGSEWGNDHTLRALAVMMQLEVRVIKNLNCPASAPEPRLHAVAIDPLDEVGSIGGVIYLFLLNEHYSTLEEDPQAPAQPPAQPLAESPADSLSVYEEHPGSVCTDQDHDVTYAYDEDGSPKLISVDSDQYEARDLLGGISLGDGTRLGLGLGLEIANPNPGVTLSLSLSLTP